MISCLIGLVVMVIIALIVLAIIETAVQPLLTLPPQVWTLIRLLVGLIILLYALGCLGFIPEVVPFRWRN